LMDRVPLTIIVPAFRRQDLTLRALESIAAQNLQPTETIVVDDGSPSPLEIEPALRARLRLRLIRHAVNRGAAAARNTGMKAATTAWISFLDSDDWLLAGSIKMRWALLGQQLTEPRGRKTIFGCGWIDFAEPAQPLWARWPGPGAEAAAFASGCWFSPGSCILLNRVAAIEAVGFQDESLRRLEDIDWFLALGQAGFRFRPQKVVGARIGRRRNQNPAVVVDMAAKLRGKWIVRGLAAEAAGRLAAYLSLEIAAAHYFAGNRMTAAYWIARSFLEFRRKSLQLSPGWDTEPPSTAAG